MADELRSDADIDIDNREAEPLLPDSDEEREGDDLDPNVNDQDEEEVLSFGDEAEPQEGDNGLVKHLRQQIRERDRELADARKTARAPEKIEVGAKPDLWEDCEGDSDKYDAAMDAWRERKAAAERQSATVNQADEEQRQRMHAELERVAGEKTALAKPDADEAFETVEAALGQARFASLALITDKGMTAKMIYALAKNPERLAALAGESDPIRYVKEVVKLEGKLKVEKRRKPIDPDTPEKGSGKISTTGADKKLAKLEAEYERTNDRSKIIAYKRELKAAAAKA